MRAYPRKTIAVFLLGALLAMTIPFGSPETVRAAAGSDGRVSDGLLPSDGGAAPEGNAASDGVMENAAASDGKLPSDGAAEAAVSEDLLAPDGQQTGPDTMVQECYAMGYLGDDAPAPALSGEAEKVLLGVEIPESFDLRSVNGSNFMSGVRDQGSYGTCWAHAVVASAESNLLMQGYTGYENLSELQLVNFTYIRNSEVAAAGGGTAGDVVSHETTGNSGNVLQYGGAAAHAITAMSAWLGLVQEETLPYTDNAHINSILAGTMDAAYARSQNVAHLDYAYEVNIKTNPEAVKALLMESGAASLSYYSGGYYNAQYHSHHQTDYSTTNHAVTLCGWDDNFPKEHFTVQPQADGAWLCKNSWGTDWYSGDAGYFWISYEDTSIQNAYFIGMNPVPDYDRLYQYDGGLFSGGFGIGTASLRGANRFVAEEDISLEAVRIELENASNTVEISVYTGGTGLDANELPDPTSGARLHDAATTTAICPYAGVYTLKLKEAVEVFEGEAFTIVVKVTVPEGDTVLLSYDHPADSGSKLSAAVAQEGQSYYYYENSYYNSRYWIDLGGARGHNLRIKALCDTGVSPTGVAGDVNKNGRLDLGDAIRTARFLVNLDRLSLRMQTVADFNGDNSVSVADVIAMCKRLAAG